MQDACTYYDLPPFVMAGDTVAAASLMLISRKDSTADCKSRLQKSDAVQQVLRIHGVLIVHRVPRNLPLQHFHFSASWAVPFSLRISSLWKTQADVLSSEHVLLFSTHSASSSMIEWRQKHRKHCPAGGGGGGGGGGG